MTLRRPVRLRIVPVLGDQLQVGDWIEFGVRCGPGQRGQAARISDIRTADLDDGDGHWRLLTVDGFGVKFAVGADDQLWIEVDLNNPEEALRVSDQKGT